MIPCYNEEAAAPLVVKAFRSALPDADIYVFDNNSQDATAEVAREAGAIVRSVTAQGKGNVVRRMFADVDADVYIMVDGDATYEASAAPAMVAKLLDENLDMVIGCRQDDDEAAYRAGHRFGNAMLTGFVGRIFGRSFSDILSGYRVFSPRFVKSFPTLSSGFEIEVEMTIHALELKMPAGEVMTRYAARPEGSESKLSTYRDGFRILGMILTLFRQERPAVFFGLVAAFLMLVSLGLAVPLAITYVQTGLVPRVPTAILCTGLAILASLSLASGLILDTVTRGRREMKLLAYLNWPPSGRR